MSGTTGTSFPEASTANIPLFSVIHMDSNPETTTYTESSFENATTDVYIQSTEADSGDGVILRPQGVLMLIYLVTGTLGVLGNSGVLLVMVSVSKLRKKLTNLFIIHQSAVDLIASVVLVTLTLTLRQYGVTGLAGELLCRLWLSTYTLFLVYTASTYNLCALTLERYYAVVYPIWHKVAFSKCKASVIMLLTWAVGFLVNLFAPITSGLQGGHCYSVSFWHSQSHQRISGVINVINKYFIPLTVMVYCYSRIIVILKRKIAPAGGEVTSQSANPHLPPHSNITGTKYLGARRNTIRMLILVCLCFILCWSWNQFFYLAFNVGVKVDFSSAYYQFSVVAVFFNCCLNPVIYLTQYDEFKAAVKKLVGVLLSRIRRYTTVSHGTTPGGSAEAIAVISHQQRQRTFAAIPATGTSVMTRSSLAVHTVTSKQLKLPRPPNV